jgi:hypothetical protein
LVGAPESAHDVHTAIFCTVPYVPLGLAEFTCESPVAVRVVVAADAVGADANDATAIRVGTTTTVANQAPRR